MGNITRDLIKQYQHPRIKLEVGAVTIYETDISGNSFSYRSGTGSGAFAPGGCVISSCNFTLNNRNGAYTNLFPDGTRIVVYIGYGPTAATATYDKLCTVYAYGATKRNTTIAVKCYDKLRAADKTTWKSFSFPMTVSQIISSAAADAGITVGTLPAAGGDISVDLRDEDGNQPELNMTCRQAIAAALLISGNFGRMTADDTLYCGWYGSDAGISVSTSWLRDYSVTDSMAYTGVQVYGQAVTGSDTRLYKLSSGQFVTEANCAAIQARLYAALVGIPVCQADLRMICDPNITAGMIVELTYPQAGSVITSRIPITSVSIKGSMAADYSCDAITADEADDLRASSEKTTEDVASGEYATKDYVDNAIAGAGGGSGGDSGTVTICIPVRSFKKNNSGMTAGNGTVEAVTFTSGGISAQIISIPSREEVERYAEKQGTTYDHIFFPVHMRATLDTYSGYVTMQCNYNDRTTAGDRIYFKNGMFIGYSLSSGFVQASSAFALSGSGCLRRDKANYPKTDGWYWT